jgi:hypothetical protein
LLDTASAAAPEAAAPITHAQTPEQPAAPASDARDYQEPDGLRDDMSAIWRKHNQQRDESGRYANGVDDAEANTAPPGAEKKGEVDAAPKGDPEKPAAPDEAVESEPKAPAIEAPRAWRNDMKAEFGKLPPQVQEYVASREKELHELRSATGRLNSEYAPIRETLGAHRDYLTAASAGDVPGFLDRLLAGARALDTDPANMIKSLARMYGVDLGEIWDPAEAPPSRELAAAEARAAQAEARLANLTRQQENAAAQAAQSNVVGVIEQFYAENPDAAELEHDMAALVPAIQAREPNLPPQELLKKAFEAAVWANPEARSKRLAAEVEAKRKADELARVEAAKAAAAKARSAAGVNVTGAVQSSAPGDIDADLRAIWRKNRA